jgi:peptidoglycan-associated lipoprotein
VAKPVPPPQPEATPVPVSQNLQAGTDLVRLCKLGASSEQEAAPKFGFDEADLTVQDRTVLQQIAECVTHGPLHGKNLQLVGRADPRGTEEYNMGLGDRRARSVSTYLERLGVSAAALDASTRGALDAHGRDETTWQRDRRVDVELAN